MTWIHLILIALIAAVTFALSRRVSARWRVLIALPLAAWVVYDLFTNGRLAYALVMLVVYLGLAVYLLASSHSARSPG